MPVNDTESMVDVMRQLGLPVILAARSSLGQLITRRFHWRRCVMRVLKWRAW